MPHPNSSRRKTPSDASLKSWFRSRWSLPERVAGWTGSGLNLEFSDPGCREAWKRALAQAIGDGPMRTALDIGTGPGTIALLWAELGCATTGLDFSPGMLRAAREQAARRGVALKLLEGDAEEVPIFRKRFDIVSSRFVLFTLPHPGYAIRRWVQMLRPGGRLVLIGHEHPDGPPAHRPGMRPGPDRDTAAERRHREALSHLPFVNHKAADLQVVMEAAGLQKIERLSPQELLAARARLRRRLKADLQLQSTPFIVVGQK